MTECIDWEESNSLAGCCSLWPQGRMQVYGGVVEEGGG